MRGRPKGDEVRTFAYVLFLISPVLTNAAGPMLYGGFGLNIGTQSLASPGNGKSQFASQGYLLEGGLEFKNGFHAGGEFGSINTINTISSKTYMETGAMSFLSLKTGFNFGKLGIGAGYRHNEVTLKSLSTTGSGYLESKYSGDTPFGYINCHFDVGKVIRTAVEAQYISGQLKSKDTDLPQVDFNEMSVGLRLFVIFD